MMMRLLKCLAIFLTGPFCILFLICLFIAFMDCIASFNWLSKFVLFMNVNSFPPLMSVINEFSWTSVSRNPMFIQLAYSTSLGFEHSKQGMLFFHIFGCKHS